MARRNNGSSLGKAVVIGIVILLVVFSVPIVSAFFYTELAESQQRINEAKEMQRDTVTVVVTYNQAITLPAARNGSSARVTNAVVRNESRGRLWEDEDYRLNGSAGTITFNRTDATSPREQVTVRYSWEPQETADTPSRMARNPTIWIVGLSAVAFVLILIAGGIIRGGRGGMR